jgi:O-antigen/teichoic acid export membrane protein
MNVIEREIRKLRNSTLARNAGWMLAGQGTGLVLQAVYFVVLARLLGAGQYGAFVGAFAFTGLLSSYCSLGSGLILLRHVSAKPDAFSGYWGNIFISVCGAGGVLVAVLAFAAPHFLNSASAPLVIFAAISNCLFAPLIEQTARIFQCFQKMRVTVVLNLLTNCMRALTAAGMLFGLHHATARQWAIASTLVTGAAAIIACTTVMASYGRPSFSLSLFLKHGMEGLGFSFAASTTTVYNDVDKTMLSHYGMNAANGIYSMAYRVVDIATMPIYSIREAVYPKLFQHGKEGVADAAELTNRLLKRTVPVSIIIALITFFAAPLIPRFLGPGFAESVAALRWLSVIPVFRCVHIMVGSVLTGAGMQGYRTLAQLAVALLNLVLNVYAIPRFGWLGAAWASIITDGTLCVLTWGILHGIVLRRTSPRVEVSQDA